MACRLRLAGMGGITFHFSSELAFLEILDELKQVDLIHPFTTQKILVIYNAI